MREKQINEFLFNRLEKLYTGLISDVLDDKLGFKDNVYIMEYNIRPLFPNIKLVGRAATALSVPVYQEPDEPYKNEIDFIESLKPGDVVVATQSGVMTAGLWGSLLSTGAKYKGAKGAIIDGISRDTKAIKEMGFPVFVKGIAPGDSKGRIEIICYNQPIKCGGVWVNPGDVVFGDDDGVVVVPQEIALEIVELAEEKFEKEKKFMKGLHNGASVKEMFDKYSVL
jgi:regulator of RNase E activity RraA